MEFELNPEREAFLSARGKVVLNACPGSGKTTVIAKKLMTLSAEYKVRYGKYCGIACISFTNTAKDEINNKFRELSGFPVRYPHLVSTIDSFINQHITLPFYYLLNREFKRPKIIDDNTFLNEVWRAKMNYKGVDGKPFCFHYPPSSIRFEQNGSFSSNGAIPAASKVNLTIFNAYCKAIKDWQIKNGLITTGDSAYIALHLLNEHPKIGEWLSKRFPHIIVDEAQDSSEIQHTIFERLIQRGLFNIELVGDPYQTLYEWRDAKPQLFLDKYHDTVNWVGLNLTDNRRSNQRIIDCFSILRRHTDSRINAISTIDKGIPILIYRYSPINTPGIVKHFDALCIHHNLNSNNQIVVRGNTLKNHLLGKATDQEPWKSALPYGLIEAKNHLESRAIKEAINLMREILVKLMRPDAGYHHHKELLVEIKSDHKINSELLSILQTLPSFELSISEWTIQTQRFLKDRLSLDNDVNFELKTRRTSTFDRAIVNDQVNVHFKRPFSERNIPITTIHQVKGKSLESILVFFNEHKHKENITFSDINNTDGAFPSEKQRLIYVAMSRAKHMLGLAFPQSITSQEIQSKFGAGVRFIIDDEING